MHRFDDGVFDATAERGSMYLFMLACVKYIHE
jgi:hypothetical protein